ncbi:hypothetical protein ACHQM5_018436 [Ranunculus cassubicifolius]
MSGAPSTVGKKLEGKIAIITCGASGIGEATARLFADEGAHMVVIADIQDQLGQSVASSIGSHRCTYIHCDVSDENQVKALVESTVNNYGHLDIMFSNAGTINQGQTILEMDLQAMDRLFAINVRGMAACVKHSARAMVESCGKGGGGESSIICTASIAAVRGSAVYEDYTMSKHAILGLVKSASNELGKYGVRVNCVSPSAVATPLMMNYLGTKDKDVAENAFSSMGNGKGMLCQVHHVADAVLFLASSQSAFVSGHNLVVDGGYLAR